MKITVRSMFAMILENKLQMDDDIDFILSDETLEDDGTIYEIDFVKSYTHGFIKSTAQTLVLEFDLNKTGPEAGAMT